MLQLKVCVVRLPDCAVQRHIMQVYFDCSCHQLWNSSALSSTVCHSDNEDQTVEAIWSHCLLQPRWGPHTPVTSASPSTASWCCLHRWPPCVAVATTSYGSSDCCQIDVIWHCQDAGPVIYSVLPGLLQCDVLRHHRLSDEPAAVCSECGCAIGVGRATLWPHNAGATGAALASGLASRWPHWSTCHCPVWLHFTWPSTVSWSPTKLHSSNSRMCVVRRICSSYGHICSDAAAGPRLWNSLTAHLRQTDINFEQFKWQLKTFLFGRWERGALWLLLNCTFQIIFTRESSYFFQRVLAIAILSVRLSITRVDQAKTVQAKITKFLPSAGWKTLVSGTVKRFHKLEGGHPERGP